jgi:hypothetical protein
MCLRHRDVPEVGLLEFSDPSLPPGPFSTKNSLQALKAIRVWRGRGWEEDCLLVFSCFPLGLSLESQARRKQASSASSMRQDLKAECSGVPAILLINTGCPQLSWPGISFYYYYYYYYKFLLGYIHYMGGANL